MTKNYTQAIKYDIVIYTEVKIVKNMYTYNIYIYII